MINRICFNSRYQKVVEYWFWDQYELPLDKGVDLLTFKEARINLLGKLNSFINGVIDLSVHADVIMESFDKNYRYEVRRAGKENIQSSVIDLEKTKFEDIFKLYKTFSLQKNIGYLSLNQLHRYLCAGRIVVSKSYWQGKDYQYHIYFSNEKEAILLASFPNVSLVDVESKYFGWANRKLHSDDIMYFQSMGLRYYNLGGIGNANSKDNENIIRFKKEMSPFPQEYFNGVIPISVKAKTIYMLKNICRI